ncbi:alpha/beta hydrolase [Nocardioides daphniae]|uniref:alpha/beta hydrolase n=1 Tax=Nocardioides daphniae TaxID=402297 RepID=UPI003B8A96B5
MVQVFPVPVGPVLLLRPPPTPCQRSPGRAAAPTAGWQDDAMHERVDPAVEDVLGAPYTSETIHLDADDEGEVVATLVKRPTHGETNCAVLHVHGFADYFFQTEYAEWWTDRGYTFYALDLRKYGRSIRPHQTPNYVEDLRSYYPELDAALRLITERDGHDVVVGSAHSTGGLVLPLWASDQAVALAGIVLNSPWFDLRGPWVVRSVGTRVINRVAQRQPRRVIPRSVSGLRPLPAPGARRRVGLQPRLEAVALLARVRGVAERRASGARPPAPWSRAAHAGPGAGLRTHHAAAGDGRGRLHQRRRPRRQADPPLGTLGEPPRHERGGGRRHARRRPVPSAGARGGLRGARPLAGGVRRGRRRTRLRRLTRAGAP